MIDPFQSAFMALVSVSAAVLGILLVSIFQNRNRYREGGYFVDKGDAAEFLFDGEVLIDATPAAKALVPKQRGQGLISWNQLTSYLERQFPGISSRLIDLKTEGTLVVTSEDDGSAPLLLRAELRGGLTRIAIINPESARNNDTLDPLSNRATQEELERLRTTVSTAPVAIWREDKKGDVIWANALYLDLAIETLDENDDLSWPLPKLFDAPASQSEPRARRLSLQMPDGAQKWFDLVIHDEKAGRLIFAISADATVQAETSLRAFMQTLTKTFAHLTTGLAIFDQHRKLAMFNPALMDLTTLPPDMLSSQPTLATFVDALRERSMIPEPRDYRSWRKQITDMEKAASTGHYQETWNLPGGQTYRVTGRPHPNGALALLIEDISTEMSQTRRYQADLELGQAVIDAMDDAIAVFSAPGIMVMANAAYVELWGHDPAGDLGADGAVESTCAHWRTRSAPSTLWDRVEDFIGEQGERESWCEETRLSCGRPIECRFTALSGGATMIAFRKFEQSEAEPASFSSSRKTA